MSSETILYSVSVAALLLALIKGVADWSYNNSQPLRPLPATVIAKRTHRSVSSDADGMNSTSTTYYVTFQNLDGSRKEICLQGYAYGLLIEGDHGTLSFQGRWYKGFVRD